MIRTLVIDDEQPARDLVTSLLRTDPEITVVGECADGHQAADFLSEQAVDLLFLDIQVPGCDGFAVLRRINRADLPVVIFVTAHDDYALQAFETHALDYLLKPFTRARFFSALDRAKKQIRTEQVNGFTDKLAALVRDPAALGREAGTPYLECFSVRSGPRSSTSRQAKST
jgi:two-component system LytT family response regulator